MSNESAQQETAAFPFITIEGDPRERGISYGRQAGERIHRSVAIYQEALAKDDMDWDRARAIAAAFIPTVEDRAPDLVEEMRGIAEGANLPSEDIFAINARTELLYGGSGADMSDPDGCTGAIALGEATLSGGVLHGQTWDWKDECADSSVVVRIVPPQGPTMMTFVEAGILARCGMNSAGVALTGNFLKCEHDAGRRGIPIPFVRRRVLEADSLALATRAVMFADLAFSNNMMISHSGGEAFDLETTPVEKFWIAPENDLLVHANHFQSPSARAKVHDIGLIANTDSLYRDRRVRARLMADHGSITIESFKAAFQDRYGHPRAVCRTPIDGPGGRSSSTVATILMDPAAGKMWVAPRPYGRHSFTEYRIA